MKRTTISLPDELAHALQREARRNNRSVSAVTRDALATHLGLADTGPRKLPFAAIGGSGHSDTGREMEELIEREWDDETRRR